MKMLRNVINLRTAHIRVGHNAQLLYTTQHRAVLIIFSLNLQTLKDKRQLRYHTVISADIVNLWTLRTCTI